MGIIVPTSIQFVTFVASYGKVMEIITQGLACLCIGESDQQLRGKSFLVMSYIVHNTETVHTPFEDKVLIQGISFIKEWMHFPNTI
jgi:hypothetical protein